MSEDETVHRIPVASDDGGPAVTQDPGRAFEHLWTPYRMAYIRGEGKPTGEHDCPFCVIPTLSDEDGLIVARGRPASPASTSTRTTPGTPWGARNRTRPAAPVSPAGRAPE